jgi:hypothetical protein
MTLVNTDNNSNITVAEQVKVYKVGETTPLSLSWSSYASYGRGTSLPPGYYKVVQTSGVPLRVLFKQPTSTSESFIFYNSLGQMVATIPPEGVSKMKIDIDNIGVYTTTYPYATKEQIPFISVSLRLNTGI